MAWSLMPVYGGAHTRWEGLERPHRWSGAAGQATMYVGSTPCMPTPHHVWVPQHVVRYPGTIYAGPMFCYPYIGSPNHSSLLWVFVDSGGTSPNIFCCVLCILHYTCFVCSVPCPASTIPASGSLPFVAWWWSCTLGLQICPSSDSCRCIKCPEPLSSFVSQTSCSEAELQIVAFHCVCRQLLSAN